MTARVATRNLYVSLVTLLTALVMLCVQVVRLVTKLALAGIDALQRLERRQAKLVQQGTPAVQAPAAPVAPETPDAAARLTSALMGLGFQKPAVRQYVSSVETRIGKEPIETLIKDGLRTLAS